MMIKLLKSKLKYIEQLKKTNASQNKIDDVKLEIYSIILGYYCFTKDMDILNLLNHDILDDISCKIQKLLNTDKISTKIKDNTLDSVKTCIEQLIKYDEKNKNKYENILTDFMYGYNYNKYYYKKYDSIVDYLIMQKDDSFNKKVDKIQKKMIKY